MPFSVEAALDSHVAALEEERLPDGYWHPSSLFGCARKAVYDFTGAEKAPIDAKSKRIFRIGHIFHEFVQTAISRAPGVKLFLPEVKVVDEERKVKGHADGLIWLEGGSVELLEIKSTRSQALKYGDIPKDDHRKQTIAYTSILRRLGGSWVLDESLGVPSDLGFHAFVDDDDVDRLLVPPLPDLERIRYVYVAKDDMESFETVQLHTPQKEAWLDGYLARLRRHVEEGTLPRRLPNKTLPSGNVSPTQHDYRCGYCPYLARCWGQDQEGID